MSSPRVVNLTFPLYPYSPVGSIFPWESPFRTEDITSYEEHGARLFAITMGSESGTRLMGPGLVSAAKQKIHELPLTALVNRPTVILHIPKRAQESISADDVATGLRLASPLRCGDAILIATGWGDEPCWKMKGEKFALNSPYLAPDAAEYLLGVMKQHGADLLLTDCTYLDNLGAQYARQEWVALPSWLRPPWPSDQAKAYLRHYTADMVRRDWPATFTLLQDVWVVVGLINCGQLRVPRTEITCLPMFIEGVGEAPCTVVATQP
jgi:kynurenine formamidase